MIMKALEFAKQVHKSQVRRFVDEPYITHPIRVAGHVMRLPYVTENMVVAALLHDVVEDCDVLVADLERRFNLSVADLVCGVTNMYTKDKYPDRNRKERKTHECERLSKLSPHIRQLKLCDRLDNLLDLQKIVRTVNPYKNDKLLSFLETYIAESYQLIQYIGIADPMINNQIVSVLDSLCWIFDSPNKD